MVLLDQNVCIQTRSNVYGQRLFEENKKFDNHWKNTKAKSFL